MLTCRSKRTAVWRYPRFSQEQASTFRRSVAVRVAAARVVENRRTISIDQPEAPDRRKPL